MRISYRREANFKVNKTRDEQFTKTMSCEKPFFAFFFSTYPLELFDYCHTVSRGKKLIQIKY